MRHLYSLCSFILTMLTVAIAVASQPDPSQIGANVWLPNSHGHFVTRTADIFKDEGISFDQPVSTTTQPFLLRAISPYDMHLDPGWDQQGWHIDARNQKLTAPGHTRVLADTGPAHRLRTVAGDPVLYIDLAAFYDDNESDRLGGFWANWRLTVTPIQVTTTGIREAGAHFLSILRGPFWSGEKSEVADTNDGFTPQVMYYQNMGIWNWHWTIPGFGQADAVEVKLDEGDGLLPPDHIVTYTVWRDDTTATPRTLADTGDLVVLTITDDGRFRRTITDSTGLTQAGRPRIRDNPGGHDVDVRFATRPMMDPMRPPNQFHTRHVIGPHRIRGQERSALVPWHPHRFTQGTTRLQYIDNISYTPGWDCDSFPFRDPHNVDDDFEFRLTPRPEGVDVETDRGGCEDRTTLFFRASDIRLPSAVRLSRTSEAGDRIYNHSPRRFAIPKTPGYNGFAFSELLAYQPNGDDDYGFEIFKAETPTHYIFDVDSFNGNSGSSIEFRGTAVEWPASTPVATVFSPWNTRAAESGAAHRVFDFPIPRPEWPYVMFHEILTYQPSGDDDMSWGLYFEGLGDYLNVQLSSGNAGSDAGAYVASEFRVLQFPSASN